MTALTWPALPYPVSATKTHSMADPATEVADEALVRATLAGDESSFRELVTRHKTRVLNTCSRFARDGQQLDDLAQEVFLRAWRKLRGFRGDAPFEHWLARLTVTACYDYIRKEKRHREPMSLDEMPVEMHDHSADAAISAGRAKELVDWAMRHLNHDERLVLTLLEIEERTVREIASLTGWSESNVKVRAFRARARLRDILTTSHEN